MSSITMRMVIAGAALSLFALTEVEGSGSTSVAFATAPMSAGGLIRRRSGPGLAAASRMSASSNSEKPKKAALRTAGQRLGSTGGELVGSGSQFYLQLVQKEINLHEEKVAAKVAAKAARPPKVTMAKKLKKKITMAFQRIKALSIFFFALIPILGNQLSS
jgi:hypothetical protein